MQNIPSFSWNYLQKLSNQIVIFCILNVYLFKWNLLFFGAIRPKMIINLFPSEWKKLLPERPGKNFFPQVFHDVVAQFILYFYRLTLYITFIWNNLFISKLVLAVFWMSVVFLKRHRKSSWKLLCIQVSKKQCRPNWRRKKFTRALRQKQ